MVLKFKRGPLNCFNAFLCVWLSGSPSAPPLPKDAKEAGGRDFVKVILINTLAQAYVRRAHRL